MRNRENRPGTSPWAASSTPARRAGCWEGTCPRSERGLQAGTLGSQLSAICGQPGAQVQALPPPPLPAAQLHGLRGISHPDADARPGSEEPGSRHGLALPQPGVFWAATYVSETPSPHLGDGTMLPPRPSTFGSNEIKVKAPTMCLAPCGAGLGNVGPADRMRLEKSFGLALPRH